MNSSSEDSTSDLPPPEITLGDAALLPYAVRATLLARYARMLFPSLREALTKSGRAFLIPRLEHNLRDATAAIQSGASADVEMPPFLMELANTFVPTNKRAGQAAVGLQASGLLASGPVFTNDALSLAYVRLANTVREDNLWLPINDWIIAYGTVSSDIHWRDQTPFSERLLDSGDHAARKEFVISKTTIATIRGLNASLLRMVRHNPETLLALSGRRFEELIAELLSERGWHVELTKQTRDGGLDIFGVSPEASERRPYLIECKRYASHRKVGVEVVRSLAGVRAVQHPQSALMVVTTSRFTQPAEQEARRLYQFHLKDYDAIMEWLRAGPLDSSIL